MGQPRLMTWNLCGREIFTPRKYFLPSLKIHESTHYAPATDADCLKRSRCTCMVFGVTLTPGANKSPFFAHISLLYSTFMCRSNTIVCWDYITKNWNRWDREQSKMKWYFLALLGRKEWKSIRKGKLRIFLQEIWTKDNPNHKIFCFSLEFFLNGLMWGLNDGVVSRGTEWVEANGRSERSPEAHNPIMKTPHHSMKEKFWAET